MEEFGIKIQYFALIAARIMGLFFTAPIFNAASIPFQARILFSLMISAVIFTVTVNFLPPLPETTGHFVLAVAGQAMIGIIIGYMVMAIFAAFQMAGEIFSVQAGLSFSEVLDPQSQVSIPILGTLKNTIGMLLFLVVDFQMDGVYVPAYLHIIRAITHSFAMVPELIPTAQVTGGILGTLDSILGAMFVTALKIGIPVIGILFITSVALGLLGRAAPQMNLMNMGIQINIIVGMVTLLILSPVVIPIMWQSFYVLYDRMGEMLQSWPRGSAAGALAP